MYFFQIAHQDGYTVDSAEGSGLQIIHSPLSFEKIVNVPITSIAINLGVAQFFLY